jgi:hypothetical protein
MVESQPLKELNFEPRDAMPVQLQNRVGNLSNMLQNEGLKDEDNNLFKTYIDQSRLSTFFQDNPFGTLNFTKVTGGIEIPLGGPIDVNQSAGYNAQYTNIFGEPMKKENFTDARYIPKAVPGQNYGLVPVNARKYNIMGEWKPPFVGKPAGARQLEYFGVGEDSGCNWYMLSGLIILVIAGILGVILSGFGLSKKKTAVVVPR